MLFRINFFLVNGLEWKHVLFDEEGLRYTSTATFFNCKINKFLVVVILALGAHDWHFTFYFLITSQHDFPSSVSCFLNIVMVILLVFSPHFSVLPHILSMVTSEGSSSHINSFHFTIVTFTWYPAGSHQIKVTIF